MIERKLTDTTQYVWTMDPALDHDAKDILERFESYYRSGDASKLPVRDGSRLCVFTLARLTRPQHLRIMRADKDRELEMCSEAVAYALRAVDGFQVDGAPLALKRQSSDVGERLTAETLDALWDPELFREMGETIIRRSRIDLLPRRA